MGTDFSRRFSRSRFGDKYVEENIQSPSDPGYEVENPKYYEDLLKKIIENECGRKEEDHVYDLRECGASAEKGRPFAFGDESRHPGPPSRCAEVPQRCPDYTGDDDNGNTDNSIASSSHIEADGSYGKCHDTLKQCCYEPEALFSFIL